VNGWKQSLKQNHTKCKQGKEISINISHIPQDCSAEGYRSARSSCAWWSCSWLWTGRRQRSSWYGPRHTQQCPVLQQVNIVCSQHAKQSCIHPSLLLIIFYTESLFRQRICDKQLLFNNFQIISDKQLLFNNFVKKLHWFLFLSQCLQENCSWVRWIKKRHGEMVGGKGCLGVVLAYSHILCSQMIKL
jgi:hypothetical protein